MGYRLSKIVNLGQNDNVQKHAKNNKTRFFYILYSDKPWVNEPIRAESAQGPIYIINKYINK